MEKEVVTIVGSFGAREAGGPGEDEAEHRRHASTVERQHLSLTHTHKYTTKLSLLVSRSLVERQHLSPPFSSFISLSLSLSMARSHSLSHLAFSRSLALSLARPHSLSHLACLVEWWLIMKRMKRRHGLDY